MTHPPGGASADVVWVPLKENSGHQGQEQFGRSESPVIGGIRRLLCVRHASWGMMMLKVISNSKGWAAGEEFKGFGVRRRWVPVLPPVRRVTLANCRPHPAALKLRPP